jgi:hypothetical protein
MVDGRSRPGNLAAIDENFQVFVARALEAADEQPKSRDECRNGPRPCPWVACRFHLLLRQNARGALRLDGPVGKPGAPSTWPAELQEPEVELGRAAQAVAALGERSTCGLDDIE